MCTFLYDTQNLPYNLFRLKKLTKRDNVFKSHHANPTQTERKKKKTSCFFYNTVVTQSFKI